MVGNLVTRSGGMTFGSMKALPAWWSMSVSMRLNQAGISLKISNHRCLWRLSACDRQVQSVHVGSEAPWAKSILCLIQLSFMLKESPHAHASLVGWWGLCKELEHFAKYTSRYYRSWSLECTWELLLVVMYLKAYALSLEPGYPVWLATVRETIPQTLKSNSSSGEHEDKKRAGLAFK